MLLCAYDALEANEQAINELNVFPVPDGDTGTNMRLTMGSAATELRQKQTPGTVTETAAQTASALLRGARGNSGVILSLLFRGLSKGLKGLETATAEDYAKAMTSGVDAASPTMLVKTSLVISMTPFSLAFLTKSKTPFVPVAPTSPKMGIVSTII